MSDIIQRSIKDVVDRLTAQGAKNYGLYAEAASTIKALRGEVKAILQREHEQCIALGLEIKELRADAEKAEAEAARLKGALEKIGEGVRDGQHCALIANLALAGETT